MAKPKKPPPGMVDVAEDLLHDIESDEDNDDDFVWSFDKNGNMIQVGGPRKDTPRNR